MTTRRAGKRIPAAELAGFERDVLEGLARKPKQIPPKYFYDGRGSQLFDAICELPEYYLTRTEIAIMRAHAADMARALGPDVLLVELGSGSSVKTPLLLEHLRSPVAYVPVDISAVHLVRTSAQLDAAHHSLTVLPVAADFTQPFSLPQPPRPPRRVAVYFPGSTIGNFDPPDVVQLLKNIRRLAGAGEMLLIGIDLKKDRETLERAYDDAQGVTAAFDLNLLERINRELDADFDLAAFRHHARYDEQLGRIEIHLVSLRDQLVRVNGHAFAFRKGEKLHTENSYKYDPDEFTALAARAGFALRQAWSDEARRFAVMLFAVK